MFIFEAFFAPLIILLTILGTCTRKTLLLPCLQEFIGKMCEKKIHPTISLHLLCEHRVTGTFSGSTELFSLNSICYLLY